jgi:hypothetical protein
MTAAGKKIASRPLRRWRIGFSKFGRNAIGDLVHKLRNQCLLRQLSVPTYQARVPSFWVFGAHYSVLDCGRPVVGGLCARLPTAVPAWIRLWRGYDDLGIANPLHFNQIRMENEPGPFVAYIGVGLIRITSVITNS